MSNEIAIKVESLGKMYQLGRKIEPASSFAGKVKQTLASPFSWLSSQIRKPTEEEILWSLRNVSFEVKRGEVIGIIGRNGAGKSTLLKVLSRITEPTEGYAEIHGRVGTLLEVGTGMHPELTGRENIYMNGTVLGMSRKEINNKFDEIVDFSGIEKFIDTPIKRYSSGMKVRLGFAIAAHLEPEILVVDEVLAVGDIAFQKKCLGKMKDVASHGRTVLFVSHNMSAVKNLCSRGLILRNGEVFFEGEIKSVIETYIDEQEKRSKYTLTEVSKDNRKNFKFTDIQFIDSMGKKKTTFEIGEELTIKIDFKAKDGFYECPSSRIDIGINNDLNEQLIWLSTSIYKNKLETKGCICFKIPEILLMTGSYNITLFCATNNGIEEWIHNVAKLNILFNDYYKTGKEVPKGYGYIITNFQLI